MTRKEYSAGAVSTSFWFMEFKKEVELLVSGRTFEEIRSLCRTENIFAASTPYRTKQIYNKVSARIRMLGDSFYPLFMQMDVSSQKLFNLAAIMAGDTLFFDFVYEVIREKLIIGSNEYTDGDLRIFFKDKQMQSEKIAGWTEQTFGRLGRIYKTFLYEAGVTDKGKDVRLIYKPLLDPQMERWMDENGMEQIKKALSGVR